MAKRYRVTFGVRLGNLITSTLLRAGVPMGGMALLTVRGRKSGLPRTTPITLGEHDGRRYLLSPFGNVNWVQNLRACGTGALSRGRHTEAISVIELTPQEAAPVLRRSLAHAPRFIRAYFDVTPDASLADFEREAPRHPVFLVRGAP